MKMKNSKERIENKKKRSGRLRSMKKAKKSEQENERESARQRSAGIERI